MINRLAQDIATAANIKLAMLNSQMEKDAGAIDSLKSFARSITDAPLYRDRITQGLSGIGAAQRELGKTVKNLNHVNSAGMIGNVLTGGATSPLSFLIGSNYIDKADKLVNGIAKSTTPLGDDLNNLVNGLKNKGYALGAGGALAGGLGGLGLGALLNSGSEE